MQEKQVESAVEAFRTLLIEQLNRVENMSSEKTDFSKKDVVTIGLIDGDGIGKIIMPQATRVLNVLLKDEIASGRVVLKKSRG